MSTKILICVPSGDSIRTETVAQLYLTNNRLLSEDYQVDLYFPMGNVIRNRNQAAEMSLDFDYLMFIDSDMIFPPDGVVKLLKADKDIIGANYKVRNVEKSNVVRFMEDGKLVMKEIPSSLFECYGIGAGFLLIKTAVFSKLTKPYFFVDMFQGEQMGEDIYFCRNAQQAGFQVWCDPTIELQHISKVYL